MINATYGELVKWLGKASIGVSSMIDEHFGINVVEFMVRSLANKYLTVFVFVLANFSFSLLPQTKTENRPPV